MIINNGRILLFFAFTIVAGSLRSSAVAADSVACRLSVINLRCEYLVDPLGIDDVEPRLSWNLTPTDVSQRGQRQSAYQVIVATEHNQLDQNRATMWDSGRVSSDSSHLVPYEGAPLESRMRCWWKVRVWDEQGNVSRWSRTARWSMGLLAPAAWNEAKWIGLESTAEAGIETGDINDANWLWYPEGNAAFDAPVATRFFRRDVVLPKERKVAQIMFFGAGDDSVIFYLNGAHIGTGHGHPNLIGVDLSQEFLPGVNQFAVAVTNGNADVPNNPSGWIGVLRVDFEIGPPLIIQSDKKWKCVKSTTDGWQTAGFAGDEWIAAMELGKAGISPWGLPWKDRWYPEYRNLPGRYARREFQTADGKTIRRATAYVCGLGFFDLHVNGRLIGDQLMGPALTGYDRRALYVTFDITDSIHSGSNAVGAVLSNGRFYAPRVQDPMPMHSYGDPQMIAQIHLAYSDGSEQTIVTDESWKMTADGPLRASNEFDGEEYDARMEMSGWATTKFDDSNWQSARQVASPGGQLESQMIEPIRVTEVLEPIRILQPKPGIWMADFGQAFYGVVRLKVSGAAGTQVSMRTSYNVLADGTLNYINDRSAKNTDVYTLKGDGVEVWHPRFRGNATRWVQIEGFPGTPTEENFRGLVTHTDHEPVGQFECSNDLLNKVYLNARWGTRLQNRSVPMEPDRDERMPWSGHPAKTSESEGWVFNVARFYEHFLHNYRMHQADDGSLQEILPPYWKFNSKDVIWPSVVTIIPDWYCNFYGDDRLLRDNYDLMKQFVLFHERTNLQPDNTMSHSTYGDWVDTASIGSNSRNFGATSRPLMGTAYLYNNCRIVERAARMFGKRDDEEYFRELADRIYTGFNERFFDVDSATYESATQCAYDLSLVFGLVPDTHRSRVADNLVNDILVANNGHTSVGLIGTQWQMQVLTNIGHPDVAYRIATRTKRPSWGYMISKGATTSWERWDTDTQDGGMNGESQKILSGNFEAWCYQTLGGINYDPEKPGFKHIILRPQPVGDLTWVRTSHVSVYGKIESSWKLDDEMIQWHVVIPPNTTATATVPTTSAGLIRESGRPLDEVSGIGGVNTAVIELEPGTYEFTAPFVQKLQ